MSKILIVGSLGQVGSELVTELRSTHGVENVIASDVRKGETPDPMFEQLDILDRERLRKVVEKHGVTEVYLLAALLSATAEKNVEFAWQLNMDGLFNVLNLAKEGVIKKIFWPSSIAVFGPSTPKNQTPQDSVMDPNTVYGISKLAGERWCAYYHQQYGVDVRSIRYPGLIGYKSLPGGGTTDYAVDIFYQAKKTGTYSCFLEEGTELPMMYMPDAIRATLEIMKADANQLKVRSSYNISGFSFSPKEIAHDIQQHLPDFSISYAPDFRQEIANSWPRSIDDKNAKDDWGWEAKYSLATMVEEMLAHIN